MVHCAVNAGTKFGRLTVVARGQNRSGRVAYDCKCECGQRTTITLRYLLSGESRSCGCLHREATSMRFMTHGHRASRKPSAEYSAWAGMIARCYNRANARYHDYGGRGIKVYQEWIDSFEKFLAYIGPKPSPSMSLDRIKNEDGYFPGNVRWATAKEQCNNTRQNVRITCDGKTKTATEWCNELGVSSSLVRQRIKRGWSPEDALATPSQRRASR